MSLPLPCPLRPAPEDARYVCELYRLTPQRWGQLIGDEWRHVRAVVRPEYSTPGNIPEAFNLLPVFRAHALHSSTAKQAQAANYARADILAPYMTDDE